MTTTPVTIATHTPGPWSIRKSPGDGRYIIGAIDHRAEAKGLRFSPEVRHTALMIADVSREQDARLIAAAPELLALVEELVRDCFSERGPLGRDALVSYTEAPPMSLQTMARALLAELDGP